MNRRSFMQQILAAGVAPAVIGSGVLMPVRPSVITSLADVREALKVLDAAEIADAMRYGFLHSDVYVDLATTERDPWFYDQRLYKGEIGVVNSGFRLVEAS